MVEFHLSWLSFQGLMLWVRCCQSVMTSWDTGLEIAIIYVNRRWFKMSAMRKTLWNTRGTTVWSSFSKRQFAWKHRWWQRILFNCCKRVEFISGLAFTVRQLFCREKVDVLEWKSALIQPQQPVVFGEVAHKVNTADRNDLSSFKGAVKLLNRLTHTADWWTDVHALTCTCAWA